MAPLCSQSAGDGFSSSYVVDAKFSNASNFTELFHLNTHILNIQEKRDLPVSMPMTNAERFGSREKSRKYLKCEKPNQHLHRKK